MAWILYLCRHGLPAQFSCYPHDGPLGMQATLEVARPLLRFSRQPPTSEELIETFFAVQQRLLDQGSAVQPKMSKPRLRWIGDKKPVQHCDPELCDFVAGLFPSARYVHLVRHPGPVAASMQRAAREWATVPAYWKESVGVILQRWLMHEEQVQQAKERLGTAVLTLRYEDLLLDPATQIQQCLAHLELEMTPGIQRAMESRLRRDNLSRTIGIEPQHQNPKLVEMMSLYGYDVDGTIRQKIARDSGVIPNVNHQINLTGY